MTTPIVSSPELHVTTPRTPKANAMVKHAGDLLQAYADENTHLQEEKLALVEKVSASDRRSALYKVAVHGVTVGAVKLSQVNDLVDRWHSEGQDPSYYADLYSARMDLSFADAGDAATKESQVVDNNPAGRQDNTTDLDYGHFDPAELDRYMATQPT